ncbi:High mobility group protein isoform 2 [Schistosoma japonicum]|uniref:High mobility group protein isoform 2 n=1 Tax=Schistosoma japonicum TaxID=6182 RepID=A0A4Z2CUY1_SCHJA|nr:High mobility group protein isoform 2 [Schistosoma japonicum]
MMVKDKNRPKPPMKPYACFVQVIREEHRKKHPTENVIFSEFSKKCAEKWKLMNMEQRKCFEEMAKLDTERFNREMAHYTPPVRMRRGRRRKRIKDPSMPKRSWSAFFFFCDAFRSKIRSEHPDWKVSDIAKELGRRWEECSDKEKYEQRAQNDKLRYEQDMQKYKAGLYVATKRARIDDPTKSDISSCLHDKSHHNVIGGETSQVSSDGGIGGGVRCEGDDDGDDDDDDDDDDGDEEECGDGEEDDVEDEDDEEEDDDRQSRSNVHEMPIGHKTPEQIVSSDTNNIMINTGS